MIWDTTDRYTVFVVDTNRTDYANLIQASANQDTKVVFFENGGDALRAASNEGPAVWIVNMELSDMSGTDFQAMLRNRGNTSPLALVSDEYSAEDEITARCAGVEMYFAKSMVHEALMATS